MPKLVKELPQGKAFSRSAEGGTLADTATRTWKIILDSPTESFDISQAIGVQIGDPLDGVNPIPCVSIDVKGDGESRMVRIVTAQYRTSGMVGSDEGGTGLPDPMLLMPDLRPANFSTSTSLYEMPATVWKWPGIEQDGLNLPYSWEPARNNLGDPLDGISKLEPIMAIRITQFEYLAGTRHSQYVGHINLEEMSLLNYATFEPYTVMFRGVEAQPHVETFGIVTYRGWMNSYEFAYKRNFVKGIYDGSDTVNMAVGWNLAVINEGYNCRAFNPANPAAEDDVFGIPLAIDDTTKGVKVPYELCPGTAVGERVRALVKIPDPENNVTRQNPSAMPIALNNNGRPRKIDPSANPPLKPIIWCKQVQPALNLVDILQLRIG